MRSAWTRARARAWRCHRAASTQTRKVKPGARVSSQPKTPTICRSISLLLPKLVLTSWRPDACTGVPTKWLRGDPWTYHQSWNAEHAASAPLQIQTRCDFASATRPARVVRTRRTRPISPSHSGESARESTRMHIAMPSRSTSFGSTATSASRASTAPPTQTPIAPPISTPLGLTVPPRNRTIGETAIASPVRGPHGNERAAERLQRRREQRGDHEHAAARASGRSAWLRAARSGRRNRRSRSTQVGGARHRSAGVSRFGSPRG